VGDQLLGDGARQPAGDGEADRGAAELVDPHHLAVQVDQRAAAVAGVDEGVVLDPEGEEAGALAGLELEVVPAPPEETLGEDALGVRDDAQGDRAGEREGRAHRHHVVADLELRGVAEAGDREVAAAREALQVELEHREVGQRVLADQLGGRLPAVGEGAAELLAVLGDVLVGEHVPLLRDDRAAPRRAPLDLLAALVLHGHRLDVDEGRKDAVAGVADEPTHALAELDLARLGERRDRRGIRGWRIARGRRGRRGRRVGRGREGGAGEGAGEDDGGRGERERP
jgi:hypothetical protein